MIELVYISEASHPFSLSELQDLLTQARLKNASLDITGLLLYSEESQRFIQVLEGDEYEVNRIYDAIVDDPRHTNVRLLGSNKITRRDFSDWRMGFSLIDDSLPDWPGVSDFLAQSARPGQYLSEPYQFGRQMLMFFRERLKQNHNENDASQIIR